jgi:hypothetical protein
VVGWTDPEGSRPWLGALLLAYYDPDGRLVYAGRVGTGINRAELERLWASPVGAGYRQNAAPRTAAAHQPLRLSAGSRPRALAQPELVVEVKFLTWIDDYLLRQVVYEGLREDKPARKWDQRFECAFLSGESGANLTFGANPVDRDQLVGLPCDRARPASSACCSPMWMKSPTAIAIGPAE